MRNFRIFCLGVLCTVLAACSSGLHPDASTTNAEHEPSMTTEFDLAAATLINRPGSATVTGRTHHAGTFTGRGAQIQLIPATPYAEEYMDHLFVGQKAYYSSRSVKNLDQDFRRYQRRTRANANGEFQFRAVAAGDYFIYGQLVEERNTVALIERITVIDGQTIQVDLNGT